MQLAWFSPKPLLWSCKSQAKNSGGSGGCGHAHACEIAMPAHGQHSIRWDSQMWPSATDILVLNYLTIF